MAEQRHPPKEKLGDGSNETESDSSTMELNLRLDGNGRTTFDPSLWAAAMSATTTAVTGSDGNDDETNRAPDAKKYACNEFKRAKTERESGSSALDDSETTQPKPLDRMHKHLTLDFSSRTTMTNLANLDPKLENALDELLFDCEVRFFVLDLYTSWF